MSKYQIALLFIDVLLLRDFSGVRLQAGLEGHIYRVKDAVSREWAFRSFKALEAIPKEEKTQQYKIKYVQAVKG